MPEATQGTWLHPVYVARQPIFDRNDEVVGYELLFRGNRQDSKAIFSSPEAATSSVVTDGYTLARSVQGAGKKVFINFTEKLLIDEAPYALPPDNCHIEILEDVRPTPDILKACRSLKDSGYSLVLDDYYGQKAIEPFFPYVDIVKVDISHLLPRQILPLMKKLQDRNIKILAEKIEDKRIYGACKKAGFDFFQGFFFCKPQLLPGNTLATSRMTKFRLLKELSHEEVAFPVLADIIQADASLSYRLLRFINSVHFSVRQKVTSIPHALALIGIRQLSQWARLSILSDLSDAFYATELVFLSAQRGKFFETLSARHSRCPFSPPTMFLMGLFSFLPALLEQDMETITDQLPLESAVRQALCGNNPEIRTWFALVQGLEKGALDQVEEARQELGLEHAEVAGHYGDAMAWAHSYLDPLTKGS